MRQLLTHTGGTGDIFGPDFMKNRLTLREHGDYLKLYGSRALTHEPGKEFHYSNYGFVLLGAIIEKVSGMSYYDYVSTRIFQPAGMTSTASLPENENVPLRAVGYMTGEAGWVANTDTLPWRGTSAGGGYSTVGDFLRFAQALEAGTLISKAMLAEATRRQQGRLRVWLSGERRRTLAELRPWRRSPRDQRRPSRVPSARLRAGGPQQSRPASGFRPG